jgi:AcrR family transcriptional regulator
MTTGPVAPAHRAMRADARHNCERLVATARIAFAEEGAEVSLIDIARRAGVGSATLYRHFPSREALLEAVYRDNVEALAAQGRELGQSAPPLDALVTWLRAFAAYTTTCRGMKELLAAVCDERSDLSSWTRETLGAAAASLLGRAQQCGAIRPDVTAHQVLRLISAVTEASEKAPGAGETGQLLTLIIDGLRYRDPAAT